MLAQHEGCVDHMAVLGYPDILVSTGTLPVDPGGAFFHDCDNVRIAMKRVFLITLAVLTTLTACAETRLEDMETGYDNADYRGDQVYSKCIDGVSYLYRSGHGTLTVQRNINDNPVGC